MSTGTQTALLFLLILFGFPIFFSALWIGITLLMSWIGGWGRLARTHAATAGQPPGRVFKRVTGMFGVTRYKNVLTVIVAEQGIYLENRFVFRPGHPPLYIPFSDMVHPRRQTLFFWEYVAFDVGSPPLASIRLPLKLFEGAPLDIAP